jgi:hypothetical protein
MDEALLDVARSIRPYLPSLIGAQAASVDEKLAALLRRAHAGEDVDAAVYEVLSGAPQTRNWAAATLGDDQLLPPDLQQRRGGNFSGLPGMADPVDAIRYVCPEDGAYAVWQLFVGDPLPGCPDHPGTALVPR